MAVEVEKAIDAAGCLPKEAKNVLHGLAAKWGDVVDSKALEVERLKGAMTNEVYRIRWTTEEGGVPCRNVLVRIYGEGVELFFDRKVEIQTFEFMSKHGQGPSLLGRFPNGRVEEFIHARTLSASDLRDSEISALIATKLKEFHGLDMPGPKTIMLWERLKLWLEVAFRFCTPDEVMEFGLNALDSELNFLQNKLPRENQQIGFCHNDLQYGNIMMDEETRLVTIIDYEYASYNPIAYDIANHFCEMAADYHTETPHIMDYSKYPGLEERRTFVRAYLGSSDEITTDAEVDSLLDDVEAYTLASHLVWGIWGIISEHVNDIDFDYKAYASQRFAQYWKRKRDLYDGF